MDQQPRYDLVIFDCDGVLIDSELLSCNALVDCLRRHEIDVDLATVLDRLVGRSPQAIVDYCAEHHRTLPEGFFAAFRAAVRTAFVPALKAVPEAARVLRHLTTPYCVASSSDLDRMEYSLDLAGLTPLVEGRLYSAQMVPRGKPAPDLFLHAASSTGAGPARCLVIEDSVSGIIAAKSAGMTAWGFVGGSHYAGRNGRALLGAAGADRVFERMTELEADELGLVHHAAP